MKDSKKHHVLSISLALVLSFGLLVVPPFIEFFCIDPPVLRRPPRWYSTALAPQIFLRENVRFYDMYWLTISFHLQAKFNSACVVKPSLVDSFRQARDFCNRSRP